MTHSSLERVESALQAIAAGKMVVLVDDEDRENEGDLVVAAQHCAAEHVNFMCKEGRGLICLAMTAKRVDELRLPMMVPKGPGHVGTAFTVSIEAREGVTTGISAADRAQTIRVASDERYGANDLVSPGHVFPLRAQDGGVLVRTGHTEGAVDLARLAGLRPAGVICEIMRDDGEMARMDDLRVFASVHGLPILTVAELVEYRIRRERLIEERGVAAFASERLGIPATSGWTVRSFVASVDPHTRFLAFCKGELAHSDEPVLLRAQSASWLGDVFGFEDGRDLGRSWARLASAFAKIEATGRGVVLYVVGPDHEGFDRELVGDAPPSLVPPGAKEFRQFGLGAQVLGRLGVSRITVMTDHPRKIVGLEGFGIEVVGTAPLGGAT